MRKIFTFMTCLFMVASAMAKDYENTLNMTIEGLGDFSSPTTVSVEGNSTDGYSITLNDFSFNGNVIGDVTMSNLKVTVDGKCTFFEEATQDAPIENGGELAAAAGNQATVTIKDGSVMSDDNLYLDLVVIVNMGADINVTAVFGENFMPVTSSYTGLMTIKSGTTTLSQQDATITLANDSRKYTLTLVDFSFGVMSFGDISVSDLMNTTTEEGAITLTYKGNITTNLGDLPGTVDLNVSSKDVMTATITISVSGMDIVVTFDSSTTAGITKVSNTDGESSVVEIYNLQGQKVMDTNRPGIYILRKADGTSTKKYVR